MHEHTMRDGHRIPALGFGTYPMSDAEAEVNVAEAIMRGYRLIDTAAQYGNERGVGRGLANGGVDREELFLTTKLAGKDHGYEATIAAAEASLRRLGTDYLDLYLIHWPNPGVNLYVESWRALIALKERGLVRSIGTSNFLPAHLDRLREETGEVPAVNQIEVQVQAQQEAARAYHEENRIITESWSPLGRMSTLEDIPQIGNIAEELDVTPAQVALRWHVQSKLVPIPKTSDVGRMEQNLNIFDWELSPEQMEEIELLNTGITRSGYDPRTHEEF
ncbi:aldo/keto reductase [Rothia sp. AR01]|uniref:Aldo/keto reductase n=1 Tax=Rothia santali TaxID=2949643 RepID=A0A9X2HDX3_9MICC|nr:aldo/keto reductase [Rothia santali]MCP3425057.1 aldo/keto reductase [Rothia santali]